MPTVYIRRVNLKETLSDAEVAAYWKFIQEEFIPMALTVPGIRLVKLYSGAGSLRADMRAVFEMDDAGAYERLLADPRMRPFIARTYAAWDMRTASQMFVRELTPELLRALSGSA
jgi:hypothetical protein